MGRRRATLAHREALTPVAGAADLQHLAEAEGVGLQRLAASDQPQALAEASPALVSLGGAGEEHQARLAALILEVVAEVQLLQPVAAGIHHRPSSKFLTGLNTSREPGVAGQKWLALSRALLPQARARKAARHTRKAEAANTAAPMIRL